MTSHHDVAGVVVALYQFADSIEGLRGEGRSLLRISGFVGNAQDPCIARADAVAEAILALIEHSKAQARALSEHEVAYDGLMKAKETFRAEAHRNAARALAAEARLAEVEAERDRTERNRDMWKGQCERQAAQLADLRAEIEKMRHENADS